MKPFEFPGYPQLVVDHLIEKGYLEAAQENDLEAQKAAFAKWREERVNNGPICPSKEDPTREAECRACRDGLWVYPFNALTGKHDYHVIPCPECSDWRDAEEKEQRRFAAMGIPDVHRRDDFASFVLVHVPPPGNVEALEAAVALAEGTAKFALLMIYGGVGNGKTHLGYAACLHVKGKKGKKIRAKWQSLSDFFAELRHEMAQKDGDAETVMDRLKEVPFLALDDLSTIFLTEWQESRLVELIDYRYARQLPTILTTNRDLKAQPDGSGRKIEALPEQILRRFREPGVGLSVRNLAPEYRRRKKQQGVER